MAHKSLMTYNCNKSGCVQIFYLHATRSLSQGLKFYRSIRNIFCTTTIHDYIYSRYLAQRLYTGRGITSILYNLSTIE
jgi:hypothetical protein